MIPEAMVNRFFLTIWFQPMCVNGDISLRSPIWRLAISNEVAWLQPNRFTPGSQAQAMLREAKRFWKSKKGTDTTLLKVIMTSL